MRIVAAVFAIGIFLMASLADSLGLFGGKEVQEGQPNIEEREIESPSSLTDLMHYFTHSNQFQLYPNFMTSMAVDIAEDPQSYLVHVDLPGVDKGDIKITISPSQHEMQITAYKQSSKEVTDKHHYKRIERHTGHMTRTIYLPDKASLEDMKANFKKGVLEIRLPKVERAPDRREVPILGEEEALLKKGEQGL